MLTQVNNHTPLQKGIGQSPEARRLKLEKAAREFESLFVYQLLRTMKASFVSGNDKESGFGKDIFMSIADDALATKIGETGSFGIAKTLMSGLERIENLDVPPVNVTPDQVENTDSQGSNRLDGSDMRFRPINIERLKLPIPSSTITVDRLVERVSRKYGVSSDLIKAVIRVESAGDKFAVSNRGAKGLMQLTDTTANHMGVKDVFNPRQNIEGGTKYLSGLLRRYSGDVRLALAAYNAGPGAVDRYGGVPPYSETTSYVEKVLDLLKRDLDSGRDSSKK
jgi:Rod binding domain-containing protein